MKTIHVWLALIALAGTCPAGGETDQREGGGSAEAALFPFGPWEFQETDEMLWLRFHRPADKDVSPLFRMPLYIQLAGVHTKFVPLAYFKGDEAERKEQKEINDAIAAFVAKHLKGRTVWIEDDSPLVFAGPNQVLGIVWLDSDRKRSLQQLLVEKGLALTQSNRRTER